MILAKIIICDLVHKKDYSIIDKLEVPLARKLLIFLIRKLIPIKLNSELGL